MKLPKTEKLLTAQNCPLKFYLDGFDVQAFLKTAVIIKEYGGTVTIPDYETVVLSVPGRTPGTQFVTFDVLWLHDSIKRNKLQDPGKYLIASGEAEEPRVAMEIPPEAVKTTDDDDEMTDSNEELLQEGEDENESVQEGIQEENKVSPRAYKPRKRKNFGGRKQVWRKKMKLQPAEEEKTIAYTVKKRVRWSHEEDEKLVRYLVDNNVIHKYRSKSLWQNIEKAEIFESPRTAGATSNHFIIKILNNIEEYTDDPEVLKKFEEAKRSNNRKKKSGIQQG